MCDSELEHCAYTTQYMIGGATMYREEFRRCINPPNTELVLWRQLPRELVATPPLICTCGLRIIPHVTKRWKGLWKLNLIDPLGILQGTITSRYSRWRTPEWNTLEYWVCGVPDDTQYVTNYSFRIRLTEFNPLVIDTSVVTWLFYNNILNISHMILIIEWFNRNLYRHQHVRKLLLA